MTVWKKLMRIFNLLLVLALILSSCSSPFLKQDENETLIVDESLPDVKIKELSEDPNYTRLDAGAVPGPTTILPVPRPTPVPKKTKETKVKGIRNKEQKTSVEALQTKTPVTSKSNGEEKMLREPDYESSVGFSNGARRPVRNPFRIGEKVVLSVRYFKAQAGELSLEIRPPVEVNGRKSYRWFTSLKTTGMFSSFYSVNDWAETLVDYETLAPTVFNLHVKESGQLKNGKGYFDPKTLKGMYFEKKYSEKKGHQEKRQEWQVMPYAQNVFSAAFYMRVFSYEVGKDYKFTVADDEKNILFKGKALRKERVETEAGTFDTIVVKPEFEIDGVFKPVGDIFFWLTDDDRKIIVRIESEIKIGTLVMEAIRLDRGGDSEI